MSLDWIVMLLGCVLAIYALVTYIVIMLKELKNSTPISRRAK